MNWDALGAIAELLGAFGVIGSLLYLGIQIKGQNVESRLNAANTMAQQWNSAVGDLATHRELAAVYLKGGADLASLDEVDLVQYSSHLGRCFRIIESMHLQHVEGRLDDESWHAVSKSMQDICTMPGVKSWWPTRSHWFSQRFQKFVRPMVDNDEPERMYRSRK